MASNPYQSSLDPVRVVVIDPSDRAQELFQEALADRECELVFATDGFAAMSKLDEALPGLIFVATHLPRLDGYQVSQIVRANSRLKSVPVVLMSHDPDLFERARARLVKANDHLVGQLTPDIITAAFDRLAK